jgi:hypothetical protein
MKRIALAGLLVVLSASTASAGVTPASAGVFETAGEWLTAYESTDSHDRLIALTHFVGIHRGLHWAVVAVISFSIGGVPFPRMAPGSWGLIAYYPQKGTSSFSLIHNFRRYLAC